MKKPVKRRKRRRRAVRGAGKSSSHGYGEATMRPIKARSGGRDEVSRMLFRKDKTIEALLRLWLRTTAVSQEHRERVLREALGNEVEEYVEIQKAAKS